MVAKRLFSLGIIITVLLLLYSVLQSGLYYQYDIDELSHANYVYLIASGEQPYRSIFMVFTPVFYWILQPVFSLSGFNFSGIFHARILMTVFFLVRLAIGTGIAYRVFGRTVAFLYIPLLLLDAFTIFAGMQIRPDNLMMVWYLSGFLFVCYAMTGAVHRRLRLLTLAGVMYGLACITMIKILPSIVITTALLWFWCVMQKKQRSFLFFVAGLLIPVVLFVLSQVYSGTLMQMVQHVFIDAQLLSKSILYPTHAVYFYHQNNILLFGFNGKPLTWVYVFLLPALAVAGTALTTRSLYRAGLRYHDGRILLKSILVVSFFAQVLFTFTFSGAFIQYFLSLSWLFAIFAAVTLEALYRGIRSYPYGVAIAMAAYFVFLAVFSWVSFRANMYRSRVGSDQLIADYARMWQRIPPNVSTYPNFLFRPIIYPLPFGAFIGDVHPRILTRLGSVADALEKHQVRYVFFDPYSRSFHDRKTRDYIDAHYEQSPGDDFLIRK